MYQGDTAAGMLGNPAGAKAPPKRIKTTVIQHHTDGSHHVTHHHAHPQHHPPESTNVPAGVGLDNLHDHMEDKLGTPNPGEPEADAGEVELE